MYHIIKHLKNYNPKEDSFDSYLTRMEDSVEVSRLSSYNDYFDYYDGNIIRYTDFIEGERPYSNIVQNFVLKLNGWLLQEQPIIKSKSVISDVIDEFIEELNENSDKALIQNVLINTSVFGDCFVKIFVDLKEIDLSLEKPDILFTFGFKVLKNPKYCFVSYNINNELDFVVVVYPELDTSFIDLNSEIKYSYPLYFEIWTRDKVYCSHNFLIDEYKYFNLSSKIDSLKNKIRYNGVKVEDRDSVFYDLYLFDNIYEEIPIVHFRNLNFFNLSYGVSDIRALTILSREKTSLINTLKDIIDYQSNPVLTIKGARFNDLDVNLANRVYSNIPKDAEFKYLSLDIGDLDTIIEKYEKILNDEISSTGLPYEFLVSSDKFIGGDSSASALKLKFSSVLIYLVLKKVFIEMSFEELYSKGLRFLNKFNNFNLDEVKFPETYTARKIVNINENLQEKIFNIYLETLMDDELVKEVVDELEGFGISIKSKDVLEVITELSEEYKDKYEEALGFIDKLSFDQSRINRFLKLRSIPYYVVEFSFKNYLPHSRRQILDDLEVELRNNLESLSGALSRLGIKNPEKKIDEILKDSEVLGTIKGLIDKNQQLELLEVQKVRSNLELLRQLEEQALQSQDIEEEPDLEELETEEDDFQEDNDLEENPITDRVLDSKGGRGRIKVKENPQKIEDQTGQSAESIVEKRKFKSQN
ncbi:MAG: hypothetical protein KatS3mg068_1573 [Candidatus Sericytochromatia bacterium]|nr:MAG: hypothetical protein KatS3mg068_1573 [Candidatus Sericytochromatia bacterium]